MEINALKKDCESEMNLGSLVFTDRIDSKIYLTHYRIGYSCCTPIRKNYKPYPDGY